MTQPMQPNPNLPPIDSSKAEFFSAPLVDLVNTDPSKLNPTELQAYLTQLRQMRGNAATVRAKTERAKKSGELKQDYSSLL